MPSAFANQPDVRLAFRQACAELRHKLRTGQPCRAEDFLTCYPQLASDPEAAAELITEEYRLRQRLGPVGSLQEWLERFPPLRDQLQTLLAPLEGGSTSESGPEPSTVAETTSDPATAAGHVVPERLGQHEFLQEIGRGGMGVVFKARHILLDRIFALKTIGSGAFAGSQEVQRFLREARAAADLDHPHIVRIFEIGCEGQRHYFTMAYVAGGSLADREKEFTDPQLVTALVEKVARAVHFAHGKGIIHRDLKPANVLLDERGEPRITDFGLAKLSDSAAELTQTGEALGTPAYMAPEQAAGQIDRISVRTDVWALGVILYELLTGQRPFPGRTSSAVKQQIRQTEPSLPGSLRPHLDRRLEAIVLKCLEKEPERRYASAAALADDLARWRRGESTEATPATWLGRTWKRLRRHTGRAAAIALALIVAASLVAVGVWMAPDRKPPPTEEQADPAAAELKRLQEEFAGGQPVNLLRADGLPRWSRPRLGGERLTFSHTANQRLVIDSFKPGVLELLAEPPRSFELSARVTLNEVKVDTEVGLCVAMAERSSPQGPEYYFCSVVLTSQASVSPSYLAAFRLERYCPAEDLPESSRSGQPTGPADGLCQALEAAALVAGSRSEQPTGPTDGTDRCDLGTEGYNRSHVHQLAMVVTPQRIEAALDGKPLGSITWKELAPMAHSRLGVKFRMDSGVPQLVQPEGSAGPLDFACIAALHVRGASAIFHDVTIRALSAQP